MVSGSYGCAKFSLEYIELILIEAQVLMHLLILLTLRTYQLAQKILVAFTLPKTREILNRECVKKISSKVDKASCYVHVKFCAVQFSLSEQLKASINQKCVKNLNEKTLIMSLGPCKRWLITDRLSFTTPKAFSP